LPRLFLDVLNNKRAINDKKTVKINWIMSTLGLLVVDLFICDKVTFIRTQKLAAKKVTIQTKEKMKKKHILTLIRTILEYYII